MGRFDALYMMGLPLQLCPLQRAQEERESSSRSRSSSSAGHEGRTQSANDWLRGHLAFPTKNSASFPRRSILQRQLAGAARLLPRFPPSLLAPLSPLSKRASSTLPGGAKLWWQQHTSMSMAVVLSLRLGFLALPNPRTRSGRLASPCRVVASAGGGPPRPITVAGDPPTVVSAPGRRIVAIGDVHGDLSQTRAALVLAGVLSTESEGHVWTGGRTVLVQVGDILDRGEDEIAILSLLSSLNVQARSQGGAVFQVNGNHETMNVEGDFRYVVPGGFDECIRFLEYLDECDGNWDYTFLNWVNVAERKKKEYRASPNGDWGPWNIVKKQKGFAARSSLFKRGGPLACELARHPVVLKINDWIFCHGGLLPHHVEYGIERMNREVSMWMKCPSEDSDGKTDIPFIAARGYDSVVWTRMYSQDPAERTRRALMLSSIVAEQTLKSMEAKGMVVGHTPQIHGVNWYLSFSNLNWQSSIQSKCDGKVWCVDVGMSYGVLYSRPEVLEIVNDRPRVLKKWRDSNDEMEVLDYL